MRALLILLLLAAASTAAYAQFNRCGRGFCPGGILGGGFPASGGGIPPLTNLRITSTGDFRVTSSGDNRAVTP